MNNEVETIYINSEVEPIYITLDRCIDMMIDEWCSIHGREEEDDVLELFCRMIQRLSKTFVVKGEKQMLMGLLEKIIMDNNLKENNEN